MCNIFSLHFPTPTTSHDRLVLSCVLEGDTKDIHTVAFTTAMIGLAAPVVSPVRMRHGCRFVRVLKKYKSHTAAAPAFLRGLWPGWKNCRPLRYTGCAWSPITPLRASACRRPPAAAMRGFNKIRGRFDARHLRNTAQYAAFHVRRFRQLIGLEPKGARKKL